MSVQLEKELDEFRAAGIGIEQLTADEIEDLVHACDRVRNPFSVLNAEACGRPISVGDVTMWRLTIGACVWLDEYARVWWDNAPKAYKWALVFAAIHSRDEGVFAQMTSEEVAYERIRDMAIRLAVREEELTEALGYALDVHHSEFGGDSPSTGQSADWEAILSRLEVVSGIPLDTWCWRRSADYAIRAYHELKNYARCAGGAKETRMRDELDYALKRLARVRSRIYARVKKAGEGAK